MRITGGVFGGRVLKTPKSDAIRPTQDRVRESVFNIIQCELAGAVFLDLFAGSGAVGIEALSRGAAAATFVERDRRHAAVLADNLKTFNLQPSTSNLISADAYRWIAAYAGDGFDIAFADPPYALGEERGYAAVLSTLAERGAVRPGGLFIAEMTAAQSVGGTDGWELLRDRVYGRTRILIWRRREGT